MMGCVSTSPVTRRLAAITTRSLVVEVTEIDISGDGSVVLHDTSED